MRDTQESLFLHSIANKYEDNVSRLVFADYLDERGESARAEFIRVQIELTNTALNADERLCLQQREYDLLMANRQKWIKTLNLPLVDVRFERGLISAARLTDWSQGEFLNSEYLVTLRELDLSRLQLTDGNIETFARNANFPALKKLMLDHNSITDRGVQALSKAAGLPNLETLYLFGNTVTEAGANALKTSGCLPLKDLDLGEPAEGYRFSKGQADMIRRTQVREELLPSVMGLFKTYPLLKSAVLCVAQYWSDEANDAVHDRLVVSELVEPIMRGISLNHDKDYKDPNIPNTEIKQEYFEELNSSVLYSTGMRWDDNNRAIPLWAAYAPEGGSQEYDSIEEVYALAVKFYRHGGYEFLPQVRPHLDGIQSEWGAEMGDE